MTGTLREKNAEGMQEEKDRNCRSDPAGKHDRIFLMIGLVLILSEIWKQYALSFCMDMGQERLWYLPFQLCSMPMYICPLVWILRNTRFRTAGITFLADFTLLSGTIAFADTSGMMYDWWPLTVHSFLWHITIAGTGIYAGICLIREMKEKAENAFALREFFLPALIYLISCVIAEVINLSADKYGIINMFYINPHYSMSQAVFAELHGVLPNNAVIMLYIVSTVCGAFLIHLLWRQAGGAVTGKKCRDKNI